MVEEVGSNPTRSFFFHSLIFFQKGATMNKLKKVKEGVQVISSFMFVTGVRMALVAFAVGIAVSDSNGGKK